MKYQARLELQLLISLTAVQTLESARKLLRKREAELAEATAEGDAAAGERAQLEQQVEASQAAIDGR